MTGADAQTLLSERVVEAKRLDERLYAFSVFVDQVAIGPPGPLAGALLAVKDVIEIAGEHLGLGSREPLPAAARRTAPVVERLLAAGATLLGRTQMVELAFGGWGTNYAVGTPCNPWSTDHHLAPGGSSSGSAVAVASGMADLALGTDTGGSVRIPAALCGVTGLRPSPARIPCDGLIHISPSLDAIGPLARSAIECWTAFDVMRAAPAGGPVEALRRALARARPLEGLRIAVAPSSVLDICEAAVADRFTAALDLFRELGANLSDFGVPFRPADDQAVAGAIIGYEAYQAFGLRVERDAEKMDSAVVGRILAGRSVDHETYMRALKQRRQLAASWLDHFQKFDILALPTVPILAKPVNEIDEADLSPSVLTRFVGLADLCALALPLELSADGRPTSLQLVAPAGADERVLLVASIMQERTDWHRRRPPAFVKGARDG